MKILVNIGHPSDIHFYKNALRILEGKGNIIKIVASNTNLINHLLRTYGFSFVNIKKYDSPLWKIIGAIHKDYELYNIAKEFKPDILTGILDTYSTHVGTIIRKPSLIFTDTEHFPYINTTTFKFASGICTPKCYKGKVPVEKHIIYEGYKELAYLHPNYFTPNPQILKELDLDDEKYIILRLVSWNAFHDISQYGINLKTLKEHINELEKYARVIITSEGSLPEEFAQYQINLPLERIHDLLYYASLYIGDGATMATEAGLLGTPSIYISSLVGTMGNFDELEKRYGLVHSFKNETMAFEKALQLQKDTNNSKASWQKKREILLREKIDVTKFMIELIEKYDS